MDDYTSALQFHQRSLAICIKMFEEERESTSDTYRVLCLTQTKMQDYTTALQSHQRVLAIRIKEFGEEHESTADSYRQLGVTQNNMHDYTSGLQSHQRALVSVLRGAAYKDQGRLEIGPKVTTFKTLSE